MQGLKRTAGFLLMLVLMAGVASGCGTPASPESTSETDAPAAVQTVASFFPVYDLVRQVGGERVGVELLIPPGVSPHGWEPSPRDVKKVKEADVYFIIGAGLETWSDQLVAAVPNPDRVEVELSEGLPLLESARVVESATSGHDEEQEAADHDEGDGHDHDEGDDHRHGAYDPHVWVDPAMARQMVETIRDTLAEVDPAGADLYRENAAALIAELDELEGQYQALADCPRKEVIISHTFFGYPSHRYGLRQVGMTGLSAEAEPGPRELAALVELARETGATHIFFEKAVSDRLARTIAEEVGAETLVLESGSGLTAAEVEAGKGMVDIYRENLENLRKGLGCSSR